MLQFDPGQLYFFGREASDRLEQAAALGIGGGNQAFDLRVRTVQFHIDAMTRLMTQTSHVQDIGGVKALWSELFDLMRQSVASSNAAQRRTIEKALKASEMAYANAFAQQAKPGAAPAPDAAQKATRRKRS